MAQWTYDNIPDQRGKLAVITGGNSGIGYEAALMLARKGAQVVLAVRSMERGNEAVAAIRHIYPQAVVEAMELDLASLASIRQFATTFLQRHATLPLLINNAGVMAIPYRRTVDGFEMQFGTNHLGHFALTGLLMPALLAAPNARMVAVSSGAHLNGKIAFDNLDGARSYSPWTVYSQSKLANLLFAYELHRRLAASGSSAISVGCHPGYAATNLQVAGPQMSGSKFSATMMSLLTRVLAQSAEMGTLPTVYAATADGVNGCDYIGPTGMFGMRGYPAKIHSNALSYDLALARRLWEVSEQLTGITYSFAR